MNLILMYEPILLRCIGGTLNRATNIFFTVAILLSVIFYIMDSFNIDVDATADEIVLESFGYCYTDVNGTKICDYPCSYHNKTRSDIYRCHNDYFNRDMLSAFEWLFTILFTLELIVRLVVAESYCQKPLWNAIVDEHGEVQEKITPEIPFFRDFMNYLDFFAILPAYLETIYTGLTGKPMAGIVNAIKMFRLFRVFKLTRHIKGTRIICESIKNSAAMIGYILYFAFVTSIVVAFVFLSAEPCITEDCLVSDVVNGMYFAIITILTIGYGDQYPLSHQGKFITVVVILFGLFYVSLPLAAMGNAFEAAYKAMYPEREKNKSPQETRQEFLNNLYQLMADCSAAKLNIDQCIGLEEYVQIENDYVMELNKVGFSSIMRKERKIIKRNAIANGLPPERVNYISHLERSKSVDHVEENSIDLDKHAGRYLDAAEILHRYRRGVAVTMKRCHKIHHEICESLSKFSPASKLHECDQLISIDRKSSKQTIASDNRKKSLKNNMYPGVIENISKSGKYFTILYDDIDRERHDMNKRERHVKLERIRPYAYSASENDVNSHEKFAKGDRVYVKCFEKHDHVHRLEQQNEERFANINYAKKGSAKGRCNDKLWLFLNAPKNSSFPCFGKFFNFFRRLVIVLSIISLLAQTSPYFNVYGPEEPTCQEEAVRWCLTIDTYGSDAVKSKSWGCYPQSCSSYNATTDSFVDGKRLLCKEGISNVTYDGMITHFRDLRNAFPYRNENLRANVTCPVSSTDTISINNALTETSEAITTTYGVDPFGGNDAEIMKLMRGLRNGAVPLCKRIQCIDNRGSLNMFLPNNVTQASLNYFFAWVEALVCAFLFLEFVLQVISVRRKKNQDYDPDNPNSKRYLNFFSGLRNPYLIIDFITLLSSIIELITVCVYRRAFEYDVWGMPGYNTMSHAYVRPFRIFVTLRLIMLNRNNNYFRILITTCQESFSRIYISIIFLLIVTLIAGGAFFTFGTYLYCVGWPYNPDNATHPFTIELESDALTNSEIMYVFNSPSKGSGGQSISIGDKCDFQNLFDSWWFAFVTMTSVGYGRYFPKTIPGKAFAIIFGVIGTLYIAMPLTIVGRKFYMVSQAVNDYRKRMKLKQKFHSAMAALSLLRINGHKFSKMTLKANDKSSKNLESENSVTKLVDSKSDLNADMAKSQISSNKSSLFENNQIDVIRSFYMVRVPVQYEEDISKESEMKLHESLSQVSHETKELIKVVGKQIIACSQDWGILGEELQKELDVHIRKGLIATRVSVEEIESSRSDAGKAENINGWRYQIRRFCDDAKFQCFVRSDGKVNWGSLTKRDESCVFLENDKVLWYHEGGGPPLPIGDPWSDEDTRELRDLVSKDGQKINWDGVSEKIQNRSSEECKNRYVIITWPPPRVLYICNKKHRSTFVERCEPGESDFWRADDSCENTWFSQVTQTFMTIVILASIVILFLDSTNVEYCRNKCPRVSANGTITYYPVDYFGARVPLKDDLQPAGLVGAKCNLDSVEIDYYCTYHVRNIFLNYDAKFGLEVTVTIVFVIELIIRLIVAQSYCRKADIKVPDTPFFLDPMSWCDIIAILPFFLVRIFDAAGIDASDKLGADDENGSSTSIGSLGVVVVILDLLKLLRIVRIFKITRHVKGTKVIWQTIGKSAGLIKIMILMLLLIFLLTGSILFFFEPCYGDISYSGASLSRSSTCEFEDIFAAGYYLVITVLTIGYGDNRPDTYIGRIIGVMIMIIGAMILAMPLAIVGAEFQIAYDKHELELEKKSGKKRESIVTQEEKRQLLMNDGFVVLGAIRQAKEIFQTAIVKSVLGDEDKNDSTHTSGNNRNASFHTAMQNLKAPVHADAHYYEAVHDALLKIYHLHLKMCKDLANIITTLEKYVPENHDKHLEIAQSDKASKLRPQMQTKNKKLCIRNICKKKNNKIAPVNHEQNPVPSTQDNDDKNKKAGGILEEYERKERYRAAAVDSKRCKDKIWLVLEVPDSSKCATATLYIRNIIYVLAIFVGWIQSDYMFGVWGPSEPHCQRNAEQICKKIGALQEDFNWKTSGSTFLIDMTNGYDNTTANDIRMANPFCFPQKCESSILDLCTGNLSTPGCMSGNEVLTHDHQCFYESAELNYNISCPTTSSSTSYQYYTEYYPVYKEIVNITTISITDKPSGFDSSPKTLPLYLPLATPVCERRVCKDNSEYRFGFVETIFNNDFQQINFFFGVFEVFFIIIFILDFSLRLYAARSYRMFLSRCTNWVEVACILISILELVIFCALNSALSYEYIGLPYLGGTWYPWDTFRFTRIIVPIRVMMSTRDMIGVDILLMSFKDAIPKLIIPTIFLFIFVLLFSGILFLFETLLICHVNWVDSGYGDGKVLAYVFDKDPSSQCAVQNLFDAFWVTFVTFSTVGYGDVFPDQGFGKIIALLIGTLGTFFLAFPLSIMGATFYTAYMTIKEKRNRLKVMRKFRRAVSLVRKIVSRGHNGIIKRSATDTMLHTDIEKQTYADEIKNLKIYMEYSSKIWKYVHLFENTSKQNCVDHEIIDEIEECHLNAMRVIGCYWDNTKKKHT